MRIQELFVVFADMGHRTYVYKVLINKDFLKHEQANINVKSRRFGIIMKPSLYVQADLLLC